MRKYTVDPTLASRPISLSTTASITLPERETLWKKYEFNKLKNVEIDITFRFEKVCSFAVEVLSAADLITDIIILLQLIENKESWWTAFMLLFMISPYLVSHSTMVGLVHTRLNTFLASTKKLKCCGRCQLIGTE